MPAEAELRDWDEQRLYLLFLTTDIDDRKRLDTLVGNRQQTEPKKRKNELIKLGRIRRSR